MSIKKWIGVFIMIFAAATLSAAESLKIAVVDMARVFDDYYKTRIVQSQLEEQLKQQLRQLILSQLTLQ